MKQIVVLIISVICCLTTFELKAQKGKEFSGTVKFRIKSTALNEEESEKPKNDSNFVTYLISGNSTKTTVPQQGFTIYKVSLGDSAQEWTIYDTPSEIIVVKKTKADFDEENETVKISITPAEETKVVCGYTCKRYDLKIENLEDGNETKIICYTTEEIGLDERINFDMPGLKGYTLYQEIIGEKNKLIIEAVEVKKKKISPAEFLMPANAKVMTYSEFMEFVNSQQQQGGDE